MTDEAITEQSTILAGPDQGKSTQLPTVVSGGAMTAFERLRDFEDAKLGKLAVRINGQIERGYGSKFRDLPEADRTHHANLEKLVVAEGKLADAQTTLTVAENEHAAAEEAVANG